ncbi:MAG: cytochrome b/b6 domain-containing protein, partial [Desulfitobacteriaceae bacterium]|nr:cytochrome b/b6 domain-containing protein [Desulfitobacteriaceae bacterium]
TAAKLYDRWDIHQRAQHWLMMVAFTLLAVTGLIIKFAFSPIAQAVAKIFGNFETLFFIHLGAAVLMTAGALYHVVYLLIKGSRRQLSGSMLPSWQDVKDLADTIGYYFGLRKEGPRFRKYSYKEKLDYVAEYWGTPVMILSGLILWFPGAAAGIMPGWVIESAHFVHQGEGLLAILVIFTWHIYTVHFSPDFFPMNRVWLTGKVSREVMEKEYPLELDRLEKEEGTDDGR